MDYRERWELKDYLIGRRLERRILMFHAGLVVLLLGFLFNFWYLQGVHGKDYAILAENNRLRRIPMKATRGEITDRNQLLIASSRPSLALTLRREGRRDLEPQLERLAPILEIPIETLRERLEQMRGRPLFEPLLLREDVSLEQLARIEAHRERFPSVEVHQAARRHYPDRDLVSHAIGYVGQVSESQLEAMQGVVHRGDIVGKTGIERAFDDLLRGERGWKLVSVNNLGRQIGEARIDQHPNHGEPLRLTLDLRLQRTLMEALGEETGAGIFLDPWNGDILAMASTPAYDPNLFADGFSHETWRAISEDPRRPLHDRVTASFYAPGSTFKVVMAVAGLGTGTVNTSDRVFCNGSATFYGRRRLCWKRGGHGWVNLIDALADSCNVYFYKLGQEMGIEPIHDYGARFGLGQRTGVDIPGEEKGILPSKAWKLETQRERWYPGDTISVAIGQGLLAVTPIQMATMISGVATGGKLPVPHLRAGAAQESRDIGLSPEMLRVVRSALKRAVDSGTGREATLGAFSVAGKTGTAQVYKHSAGIDSNKLPKEERDHAWFVGYAPAEQPRIAFAVIVEHGGHGGSSAAPIARKVLEVFFSDEEQEPVVEEPMRAGAPSLEDLVVRSAAAR